MISKHISYKEGVHSITAIRKGIDNEPNEEQLANMKLVANNVFEPLRVFINGPIKVNSFFRSPDLNKAIGGSTKSQHCKGQAIDIGLLVRSLLLIAIVAFIVAIFIYLFFIITIMSLQLLLM